MTKKMIKTLMLVGLGVAGTLIYEKYNREIMQLVEDGYDVMCEKMSSNKSCECDDNCCCKEK